MQKLIFVIALISSCYGDIVRPVHPVDQISNHLGNRIWGGSLASTDQFPWQAGLYITTLSGTYLCGGSLITTKYVLTAAHCVIGATVIEVRLGSNNYNLPAQRILMSNYQYYPTYNSSTLDNDIAIIQLSVPATLGNSVKTIALPKFSQSCSTYAGLLAQVSGYGATGTNNPISTSLRYANVEVISNSDCSAYYGSLISSKMICTSNTKTSQGTCFGDSGGPLVLNDNGVLRQIGVVSFVSGAGCDQGPAGFTRTQAYLSWIAGVTGMNYVA